MRNASGDLVPFADVTSESRAIPFSVMLAMPVRVFPLAFSPRAGGRTAVGSAVPGGPITGTVLVITFVPLFFVIVSRLSNRRRMREQAGKPEPGAT